MVPAFDDDADLGGGPGVRVHHAHLVVDQVHVPDGRVEVLQRLAQRPVQCVHGTVAFARRVLHLSLDGQLDRGHRHGIAVLESVHHDVEPVEVEEIPVFSDEFPDEQVEGRLGALELVAGVLELLHAFQHLLHQLRMGAKLLHVGLRQDARPARQLADQEPSFVPHALGLDVLVGPAHLLDGVHVQSGLVRESVDPDVGLTVARDDVG